DTTRHRVSQQIIRTRPIPQISPRRFGLLTPGMAGEDTPLHRLAGGGSAMRARWLAGHGVRAAVAPLVVVPVLIGSGPGAPSASGPSSSSGRGRSGGMAPDAGRRGHAPARASTGTWWLPPPTAGRWGRTTASAVPTGP